MKTIVRGILGATILAGALAIITPVTPAAAKGESARCASCGPTSSTTYRYRTVNKVTNSTRYRDVTKTHVRQHVNRVVTVTRVQPIHRVNVVTRVHNRTVVQNSTRHVAQTQMLPARVITTARTVNLGCRC